MQYRPPNANQEVSIANHFGSVSDSLGRLAAASECMASDTNITFRIFPIVKYLHVYIMRWLFIFTL